MTFFNRLDAVSCIAVQSAVPDALFTPRHRFFPAEARMKTVEQILKTKSQHQTVYTIGPDDSVLDALKMLA